MTYIVQNGDNLWAIARRFGISVQELMSANHLTTSSVLYVGQRLYIPAAQGTPPPSAPPASGGASLEGRVAKLEQEFNQLVEIVDHHRVQLAELTRRVHALEQRPR